MKYIGCNRKWTIKSNHVKLFMLDWILRLMMNKCNIIGEIERSKYTTRVPVIDHWETFANGVERMNWIHLASTNIWWNEIKMTIQHHTDGILFLIFYHVSKWNQSKVSLLARWMTFFCYLQVSRSALTLNWMIAFIWSIILNQGKFKSCLADISIQLF